MLIDIPEEEVILLLNTLTGVLCSNEMMNAFFMHLVVMHGLAADESG